MFPKRVGKIESLHFNTDLKVNQTEGKVILETVDHDMLRFQKIEIPKDRLDEVILLLQKAKKDT